MNSESGSAMEEHFKELPVSDYYRSWVVDFRTISRTGSWWTAVVLLKNPDKPKPTMALYKWQRTNGDWKQRSKFNINSGKEIKKAIIAISELLEVHRSS